MLEKIYRVLRARIQVVELGLSLALEERASKPYESKVFYPNILWLNQRLMTLELLSTLLKYVLIIFGDPGNSFNVLFRQRELRSCPFSYWNFKNIQKRIRLFSLAGTAAVVIIAVSTSLITNFLFGGRLPAWAATFNLTQNNWTAASTTAIAVHPATTTLFAVKDGNVQVGVGSVTLTAATTTWTETLDADFNAGQKNAVAVANNSVKLLKPDGATCAVDGDCYNNWCNGTTCANNWISGPCAGIAVYYLDVATTKQWKTTDTACGATECQTGLDTSHPANMALKFSNTIDFTAYPARDACKAIGARLPTMTELACIYTNRTSYRNNFQSNYYWSATELGTNGAWYVGFNNGYQDGSSKSGALYVRCVK